MSDFPTLTTERLILGPLSEQDIPKIIAYAGNKKVASTTLNIPHPYGEKDAVFWIDSARKGWADKTQYTFAIRTKLDKAFIGGIGLKVNQRFERAAAGYWIAELFWNQGYTTEALSALLKFGFETLQLNKIYATHLVENLASGKVMLKNGMLKEGELKEHLKKDGIFQTLLQYRLTKQEYTAKITPEKK
jgi:RimJ/RimL family protein N-acetyltransferase